MAILYPDIKTIKNFNPYPTDWELFLIKFLVNNLSDEFEIYFQPFLNGDMPDIIIIKKNSWIIIIEVKDRHLINYYIDDKNNWIVKKNKSIIKSPFSQVEKYKNNLFDLHIDLLLNNSIFDNKIYSIISTLVYFHNETFDSIKNFTNNNSKKIKYIWKDSLNLFFLNKILKNFNLSYNWKSKYFTEEIYNSFKRFLKPSLHTLEQWEFIQFEINQIKLMKSEPPFFRKIKWVAGSWKTIILANRVVQSHKRHKGKVLILTYNITMKNYIHDNISKVRDNFNWENFYISNYHQFITQELNNLSVNISRVENIENIDLYLEKNYYSNIKLFESLKNNIIKYKSIFIDEIQDYKENRIRILQDYFLEDNWEFIVFWDEKQNVYHRKLDIEKKVIIPWITWKWNILNKTFRLKENIAKLASKFQNFFLKEKYEIDWSIESSKQSTLKIEEDCIENYFINSKWKILLDEVSNLIIKIINDKKIWPNDICIMSSKIDWIRTFEYEIRRKTKEKTKIMFANYEEYKEIKSKSKSELELNKELDRIEKGRKNNFWLNDWTMKFSTIHSFKWLEIHTVFLIIDEKEENDELIYTAITRARINLIIINISNLRYKWFFDENNDLVKNF